jgi:hypothetical protein
MQRGRDCDVTARTFNRHATFRVYLLHPEVRSMSEAFRMYLLHSDADLSCSGPARARTVQNACSVCQQRAQRACTQITTRGAHAHDLEAELIQVGGWDASSDSEGGSTVEGSEEHFDESEHVDGLTEEERSTDSEDGFGEEVEETRASEREGCRSSEGSDFEGENEGEGCRSPEGSDFAAEEGYEEDDSNAEEGHEGMWGEVQEALSTMGNADYDENLCARSQASRSSSSS